MEKEKIRTFETGATRNLDQDKLDYEGFFSPYAIERFAEYMHKHRKQADGSLRDSDNWQKGIPLSAYMKSMWRHFVDVWKEYKGIRTTEGMEEALCGVIFNAMGYLHEIKKEPKIDSVHVPGSLLPYHDGMVIPTGWEIHRTLNGKYIIKL